MAILFYDNNNRGFASCQKLAAPVMASTKEALRLAYELMEEYGNNDLHEVSVDMTEGRFLTILVKTGKVVVQSVEGPILKTWYINQ